MEFTWREDLNEIIPFGTGTIYRIYAEGSPYLQLSFDNGLSFIGSNTSKKGVQGWEVIFTGCVGVRYFKIRDGRDGCVIDSGQLDGSIHIDCDGIPTPVVITPVPLPVPQPIQLPLPITVIPVPVFIGPPVPQPIPVPVELPIFLPTPPPPDVSVYATPSYNTGVVRLDQDGNIAETYMKLELNGMILKDLFYTSSLGRENNEHEKLYHIGFFGRHDAHTYFTQAQMAAGIDVSAYAGREITVYAIWRKTSQAWVIPAFRHQTIYIPKSNNVGIVVEQGKVYHKFPTNRIWKESMNAYFEEYITTINDPRMAVMQFTTYSESVSPKYQSMGMYGKKGSLGKSMQLIGDSFIYDSLYYGSNQPHERHPQAYDQHVPAQYTSTQDWWNNWLPQFKSFWGNQARQKVIDAFNQLNGAFNYHFVNNELYYMWLGDDEFMSWIRDGYASFVARTGAKVAAWNSSEAKFPSMTIVGDVGYPIPNARTRTYNDIIFNSGGNWTNYLNKSDKFMTTYSSSNLINGVNVNQIGSYQNATDNKGGLFFALIVECMIMEKHNVNKDTVATWWHTIELSLYDSTQHWKRYKGKTYRTGVKPEVGAEIEYTFGAILKFFNKFGLMDMWSDPLNWSLQSDNPSVGVYPFFDIFEVTNGGDIPASFENTQSRESFLSVAPVNNLMDALTLPTYGYINSPVEVADVYWNGTLRTNENKYPIACMEDIAPFVAYRKVGNKALVFGWIVGNHSILNVGFKIDGTDYSIRLEGCYPSIMELELTGVVIPVPVVIPTPSPIPVPVPANNTVYYNLSRCDGGSTGERAKMDNNLGLPNGTAVKSNGGICYYINGTSETITTNIIEGTYSSCNACISGSNPVPVPPTPSPTPIPTQIPVPINENVNTDGYIFQAGYMDGNPYLSQYYDKYRSMVKNSFIGTPEVRLEFPSNTISYHDRGIAGTIIYCTVSLYDSQNRLIIQSSGAGAIEGDPIWGNNHGLYYKIPEGQYRVVIEYNGSNPTGVEAWVLAECFRQDSNSSSGYYEYGPAERIGYQYPSNSKEFTFNTAGVKEQPNGLLKINNVSR